MVKWLASVIAAAEKELVELLESEKERPPTLPEKSVDGEYDERAYTSRI